MDDDANSWGTHRKSAHRPPRDQRPTGTREWPPPITRSHLSQVESALGLNSDPPPWTAERILLIQQARDALSTLPIREEMAVTLRMGGMDEVAVAGAMRMSRREVRRLLAHGLEEVRRKLCEQ